MVRVQSRPKVNPKSPDRGIDVERGFMQESDRGGGGRRKGWGASGGWEEEEEVYRHDAKR